MGAIGRGLVLGFQQAPVDQRFVGRLDHRGACANAAKSRVDQEFLEIGTGQQGKVLIAAEDEIGESTADASATIRKISEPGCIVFDESRDGIVPMGSTHPIEPAGFETPMNFAKVE